MCSERDVMMVLDALLVAARRFFTASLAAGDVVVVDALLGSLRRSNEVRTNLGGTWPPLGTLEAADQICHCFERITAACAGVLGLGLGGRAAGAASARSALGTCAAARGTA